MSEFARKFKRSVKIKWISGRYFIVVSVRIKEKRYELI